MHKHVFEWRLPLFGSPLYLESNMGPQIYGNPQRGLVSKLGGLAHVIATCLIHPLYLWKGPLIHKVWMICPND